ncbi:MAG: DNA primase large subunit PriL [Methanobrevibacter sp.]|uniref:DNA primase large subunit PriL n=1 Tax=Methanobrevibacter sp. TaxID=66852 RepID=UPI0026DEC1B6|nr:DNA primase large subunit PriL [Methanobrevibacter sp.]MDO5849247.1 DNA primase large subunit PriL [Methanobrevibacter sp.]
MAEISYINPLSEEGRGIVKEYGDLNQLTEENEDLVSSIMHTPNQKISDDELIPGSIKELAINKIKWAIEKKNNKNFDSREYEYLSNSEIYQEDVIAFHVLCQALAIQFNTSSRETKLFIDSIGLLIEERLSKITPSIRYEIIDEILRDIAVDGSIKWTSLKEVIGSKKLSLVQLLLDNGEIILEKEEFLEKYGDKFDGRPADRIYDIIVGQKIKELILSRLIMQKTEEYIKRIKEMSKIIEMHPIILELGEQLKEIIPEEMSKYNTYYAGSGGLYGTVKGGKLVPEAFPPCIQNTIEGVSSGGRNDAIVLLLTSFVSYARLYPGIFGSDESVKISDIDTDLKITENEILPLIYQAADNCTPPLFDDQPQEKLNIISKLGFGLHDEISLENEGETTWYTPMSCEKIKMHLPQLCKPDGSCKGLNNPLSCYGRKKYQIDKKGKKESS